MKRKQFSEEQIIGILKEAEAGAVVTELCRRHGMSSATYYAWKAKFGGLEVSDAKRLRALEEENARLKRLLADKRRTIARVNLPEPVAGITSASETRVWRFDPTITVERDIADDKGRVIIAAGTRVNPLDTVPLRAPLVFLDGDDPAQLSWAAQRYGATRAKLILVRGAPLELMKARQRRFYFDQGGNLVKHFGIRAVPATVEQQGRLLVITEAPIKPQERLPS